MNKENQSKERERRKGEKHPCYRRPIAVNPMVTAALPVEPWRRSSMTQERLEELIEEGLLCPITSTIVPEWITPEKGVDMSNPPTGYVLSFMAFHERGLGVLASQFLRALPFWYEVELHNFNPNSIAQAAIFAAVCEGYLGIPPHWNL
jgi:hypothetical protein